MEALTKDKLEQSIANENIRLDNCREVLQKWEREYEWITNNYRNKADVLEAKIAGLKQSISSGEKFLSECERQLVKLNQNEK